MRNYLERGKKEEQEEDASPETQRGQRGKVEHAQTQSSLPSLLLIKEEFAATSIAIKSESAAHRIVIGLKKAKIRRLERRQDMESRKLCSVVETAPHLNAAAKLGTNKEKSLADLIPADNFDDVSQLNRLLGQSTGTGDHKHKVGGHHFTLIPGNVTQRFTKGYAFKEVVAGLV
jgi:hypothetical protein